MTTRRNDGENEFLIKATKTKSSATLQMFTATASMLIFLFFTFRQHDIATLYVDIIIHNYRSDKLAEIQIREKEKCNVHIIIGRNLS